MESALNKPLVGNLVYSLLGRSSSGSWKNKPADWSDIRKDCPANSIALYSAHKADFSQYDNLGFTANCTGGYNVFIDGVQYGTTYASGATCTITWSNTANTVQSLLAEGKCVQSGTPSPASPVSITCNNGVLKVDANGDIYSDGTTETFSDGTNTATAEMLLAVNSVTDTQEIISGSVTRNVGCIVLNGTENWETFGYWFRADLLDNNTFNNLICTHFEQGPATTPDRIMKTAGESYLHINYSGAETVEEFKTWLATQYSNGTPVIVLYALENPTTDTVTSQSLTGTVSLTQASLNNLRYTVNYKYSGDDITTPETLKAHKIWIIPATEGNNITDFHCARVASSGNEEQGLLWAHFNIDNKINLETAFFGSGYTFNEKILRAVTSKNNLLKMGGYMVFRECLSIEYLPVIAENNGIGYYTYTGTKKLTQIKIKDTAYAGDMSTMFQNSGIKKIKLSNSSISITNGTKMFQGCEDIEELPDITFTNTTDLTDFITNATSLKDTVLDTRAAAGLTKIGCYGTSQYFMSGFKGLRVSNQAPFNNATSPQINVSYTGMDKSALVQLFNDLPYNVGYEVVGSPTINNGVASGFSNSDYLTLPSFIRNNFKQLFKIKTPNSFIAYAGLWQENTINYKSKIMFSNTGKIIVNLSSLGNSWDIADNILSNLSLDTNKEYYIDFSYSDGYYTIKYSLDGETFNDLITPIESNSVLRTAGSIIGYNSTNNVAFNGEIDLNNTYIKVNDVYWFRGQPAMTKTLSCIGATGTEDLTQEDKDIALNKGWSLTLS